MSEPKILTHAEVAAARTSSAFLPKQQKVVDFILDSHEALRALLAEAQQEREWLREQLDRQTENAATFLRERDAMSEAFAIAREERDLFYDRKEAAERLAEQRGEALRWFFSQHLGRSSEAMFREALGIPASERERPWDRGDSEGVETTYGNAPSWLRPLMRPRLEWYREIARLGWPADPPPRAALADGGQQKAAE